MAFFQVRWFWLAVLVGIFSMPVGSVSAATQALALLETGGPIQLACSKGVCKAEFSTYCLQKERALPKAHDPYVLAKGSRLDLVLTSADGKQRRISAANHIAVRAARAGHTAVVIEMSETVLSEFGAQRAAIDVGEQITLMPVPVPGDENPQTVQDQQLATGPLRALGARIVDRNVDAVATVRVLTRLVNALPHKNAVGDGAQTRLWREAVLPRFVDSPVADRKIASREYKTCWKDRVVELGGVPVRHCLERRHDNLMWNNVRRYWDGVGAGS